jgi:hypothetical protein
MNVSFCAYLFSSSESFSLACRCQGILFPAVSTARPRSPKISKQIILKAALSTSILVGAEIGELFVRRQRTRNFLPFLQSIANHFRNFAFISCLQERTKKCCFAFDFVLCAL